VSGELGCVYLSVHTPRYCTYEAAFAGKVAHPDFRAVRDGLVEQGRHVADARPDVIVINSCHLITTFPTVVDGTRESFTWGRLIAEGVAAVGRRAAFVASGSVSHKLVRGPEAWPSPADQELDHRFARMLADGEYEKLWAWLPAYAETAEPEMGGRHLAMMLGAILGAQRKFATTVHAYGPSSGSGNYVISLAAR